MGTKTNYVSPPKRILLLALSLLFAGLMVATPTKVSALNMSNPVDAVKSYQYYYAVSSCLLENFDVNDVARNQIGRGEIVDVGHLIDPDGEQECSTILPGAIRFWGYQDVVTALVDWGFVVDGDRYRNTSNVVSDFQSAINKKIYSGRTPVLNPAQLYVLYSNSFLVGCKATDKIEYDTANQAMKDMADQGENDTHVTSIVEGDPPAAKKYIYKVSSSTAVIGMFDESSPAQHERECRTLASLTTQFSGSFVDWAKQPGNAQIAQEVLGVVTSGNNNASGSTAVPDNCPIDASGSMRWLGCAIFNAGKEAAEKLASYIDDFLYTDPRRVFDDTGVKNAATTFRNFGIGLIIIAGLIMVISQALGLELFDAYTFKKLLPRMGVALILVAVAWPVLRLAVVLSNDFGQLIETILVSIVGNAGSTGGESIGAGVTAVLLGAVAAGGAFVLLGGLGLASLLLTIVLALLLGLIVLSIRQLIILVCIVIAPLAIAAYVLPGTQKLWNFWKNTFITALLMYPIIMGFIGAGKAMSYLMGGATGGSGTLSLLAVLVYFAPFFLLPFAFKMAGGLMSTIFSIANDKERGAFDRLKKFRGQRMGKNWQSSREGNRFRGNNALSNRLNRGLEYGTNLEKGGVNPMQWRSRMRTGLADSSHDEASKFMKENAVFGAISGDDAKLSAARFTNRSEIETELARFDEGRFAGAGNARARTDAANQILRAQREVSEETFRIARARSMPATGTGYQYTDENGNTVVDYNRMIDDINEAYGNDRNGAGRALAEMRSSLSNSGHIAGQAGYGTWANAMEQRYRGRISGDDAHNMIMDDAINSVDPRSATLGKPSSAAAMARAYNRRISTLVEEMNGNVASIPNGTNQFGVPQFRVPTQQDVDVAVSSAAGVLDTLSSASPQNASAFANELMNQHIEGGSLRLRDSTIDRDGGVQGPQHAITVRDMVEERRQRPEVRARRRDWGQEEQEFRVRTGGDPNPPGAGGGPAGQGPA